MLSSAGVASHLYKTAIFGEANGEYYRLGYWLFNPAQGYQLAMPLQAWEQTSRKKRRLSRGQFDSDIQSGYTKITSDL